MSLTALEAVIKHMVLMATMVLRGIFIKILENIVQLHFVCGSNHHTQRHITLTF